MGQINLGKVRGTMIYTGGYVAGSSASGTVFENTGIEKAYEGDLYINTDNSGDYAGCIYECIKPGNALEATWSYKGNIRGPKTATVNSLKSTSTEDALAAYQGNRLFEMMVDSGVFCKNVIVDYDQVAYGLKVRIDNVDSALIIVADGKEYEYTYTASGTAETTKVSIVLGENIGMPQSGGVVSEIRSDNAYIYTYELTGVSAETVYSKNMDLWSSINEALLSHEVTGTVIDGEETLFMGPIHKFVNGIKKAFYPITHAKAVWFDKANKRTVHDEISELNKKTDKFYSSPSMLGINSYHIPDIVQAMPVQSRFFDEVVNSSAYALDSANNKFPINNGLLEIIRPASHVGRTRVLYFAKTNVETYGLYYCLLDETNWTIKGWTKIATTEDVGSGVDTSILGSQSTLPSPTSSFAWNIKQNASDIDSLESLLGTQSILPLPSSTFAYNIQQLNAIVGPQSNLPLPSSSITYNIAQIGADSGWKTATLNSAFELSTSTAPIQYRKIGNLVYIRGSIKATQTVSDGETIFTLPTGYRPSRQEYSLQSAGSKTYLLTVTAAGAVNVSRCSLSSGDWLGIGASFLVG